MEELRDILQELNVTDPEKNLGAIPTDNTNIRCQICSDKGWFTPRVPHGDPNFGKATTCKCQLERIESDRFMRLQKYSNIGQLTRFTFNTLNQNGLSLDFENQQMFNIAYKAALTYSENPTGMLTFTGPNGSGKTHLAASIANQFISNGKLCFFINVPDLLDHLRSSFAPESDVNYSDLFEQVKNSPLLILDDLKYESSPWANEKLRQLINFRYSSNLPTVFTSVNEQDSLDPYIQTRIGNYEQNRDYKIQDSTNSQTSNLGKVPHSMLQRMTFNSFNHKGNNSTSSQQSSLESAKFAAENYSSDPEGWLTFFGNTGVGKTHLAIAIAETQISYNKPVFFAIVPELMDHLRQTYNPSTTQTHDALFKEIKETPLLILDDLGQERSSPWADEKLYQIIVHRHNWRIPTVITSMNDFTVETGPIGSRIQDPSIGQLVRIDAPDFRRKSRRKYS